MKNTNDHFYGWWVIEDGQNRKRKFGFVGLNGGTSSGKVAISLLLLPQYQNNYVSTLALRHLYHFYRIHGPNTEYDGIQNATFFLSAHPNNVAVLKMFQNFQISCVHSGFHPNIKLTKENMVKVRRLFFEFNMRNNPIKLENVWVFPMNNNNSMIMAPPNEREEEGEDLTYQLR